MFGILIGILIGFAIVWLIFNVWDYISYVEPFDVDEKSLIDDELFDSIKCPKCACYQYEMCYVDPLFNTGKYGRCKACGWTFDLPEDSTQGVFEAKGNYPR